MLPNKGPFLIDGPALVQTHLSALSFSVFLPLSPSNLRPCSFSSRYCLPGIKYRRHGFHNKSFKSFPLNQATLTSFLITPILHLLLEPLPAVLKTSHWSRDSMAEFRCPASAPPPSGEGVCTGTIPGSRGSVSCCGAPSLALPGSGDSLISLTRIRCLSLRTCCSPWVGKSMQDIFQEAL